MSTNQCLDKASLEKLQFEHCQRIFKLYENKHDQFQKILNRLISFSLLFFLLILLPYAATEMERVALDKNLQGLPEWVKALNIKSKNHQKAIQGIDSLQQKIKQMPHNLREFIFNVHNVPSIEHSPFQYQQSMISQSQALAPDLPCLNLDKTTQKWLSCRVKQQVLQQLKDFELILKMKVLPYMPENHQRLNDGLKRLSNNFITKLQKKPQFWQSYQGKVRLFKLEPEIEQDFQAFNKMTKAEAKKIQEKFELAQDKLKQQQQKQKQLLAMQKQIKKRLDSIESPLGKLPIGFSESILIFPCLLATFFFIYSHLFCETIRLRVTFKKLYQIKDPSKILLDNEQISLIAPLWIDPINPTQNRLLRWGLFLLPVFMFVIACGQIIYLWQMPETFDLSRYLNRQVYTVLYLISTTIILYAIIKVNKEISTCE